MKFLDTETCGFHGPVVLIQYSNQLDGEIYRHNVWLETIQSTLDIIKGFCDEGICGFNLGYDWFHLAQLHSVLVLLGRAVGMEARPIDHIDRYAELEPFGRDGLCIKPKTALDLMLFARKGPYQSTMDRKDIKIKRVPSALAQPLVEELNKRIKLKDIYFARQKDKGKRWTVTPIKNDPNFVNVTLKFKASSSLKALAVDALGINQDDVLIFKDIGVDKQYNPIEVGWAPFAKALSSKEDHWFAKIRKGGGWKKGRTWPGVIKYHIQHWAYNERAIKYSIDDVDYLHKLYHYFDEPEPGDDDSILACMVGSVRWRGFGVDLKRIDVLLTKAIEREKAAPKHSEHVRKYVFEALDPIERTVCKIKDSTKKAILEEISRMKQEQPDGTLIEHPAAIRAKQCLDARKARFDRTLFEKLRIAGRFHASVKVIGSLSSRMSGGDGMNALGVQHLKEIRKAFTLAMGELKLAGGDFSAYEISIADADYNDPKLRANLLTCYICKYQRSLEEFDALFCPNCKRAESKCEGCKGTAYTFENGKTECKCGNPRPGTPLELTTRKFHGLFGMQLAPGKSYEEILATKGQDPDLYDQGKRGGFSQLFGGNWQTLVNRLGIDEEVARQAEQGFMYEYQGVGCARGRNYDSFCSMRQPGGIGTQVYWHEPKDYAESLNGFRRYFTLENNICRILFELANDPPEAWTKLKLECVRRDRNQKVGGAVRSALFAAAFAVQSHNMRAAGNHRIQATGAIETKRLQCRLWRHQPAGIHPWRIQPLNVHDELMTPCLPELKPIIKQDVNDFVKERRSLIPLLKMDFVTEMESWADK